MTTKQIREYELSFSRDNYQCVICKKPAIQQAHVLDNTIVNNKKYGKDIIDNHNNIRSVCSLECNTKCRISKENERNILARLIEKNLKNILSVDYINKVISGEIQ